MIAAKEQVIEARGMGPGRVSEALIMIAGTQGYSVAASGPNRFRLARTYRPKWANVAALVLAPFFGLGLLFLLVKRTETCDGMIVEDRTGVRLILTGAVTPVLFMELSEAVSMQPLATASALAPTAFAPQDVPRPIATLPVIPADVPLSGLTVPDQDRTISAAQLAAMRSSAALALQFPDGRTVPIGDGLVVGRNPEADPGLPSARLLQVTDRSLSKTHATFGATAHGVWVCDHHSTNGTSVRLNDSITACQAGARVVLPLGAAVTLGEVHVNVVRAGL